MEKEGLASKPVELVYTDLCGPSRKKSPRGEEYFILFIDGFSRRIHESEFCFSNVARI